MLRRKAGFIGCRARARNFEASTDTPSRANVCAYLPSAPERAPAHDAPVRDALAHARTCMPAPA
ncbi:MAG: hypothetical protein JF591_17970 [Lysobacter sp.]|nr:hypothetical protein [Lysobacter sp.]